MSPVWPCYWSRQEMWSACFSKGSERRWSFNEQYTGSYWFSKYVCSLITTLICECSRKTHFQLKSYLERPGELPAMASAHYTCVCCWNSGSSLQSSQRPICSHHYPTKILYNLPTFVSEVKTFALSLWQNQKPFQSTAVEGHTWQVATDNWRTLSSFRQFV